MKRDYIAYFATGFISFVFIGFIGTAYPALEIPMLLIVLLSIALVLVIGAYDFAKGLHNHGGLNRHWKIVLQPTATTVTALILIILIAVFLGVYIGV